MRRALRRVGCLAGALIWLAVLLLPCLAFVLAVRGDITWERSRFSQDRLWLIRESGQNGLALSDTRPLGRTDADEVCARTVVTFWLWSQGSVERTSYCQCEQRTPSGDWTLSRECPSP